MKSKSYKSTSSIAGFSLMQGLPNMLLKVTFTVLQPTALIPIQ
jgi:hypothetical protein